MTPGVSLSVCVWRNMAFLRFRHRLARNVHEFRSETKINIKTYTIEIMNIKPLADRVLIKPTPAEETTLSGIIIPDSAKEKPLRGTVLATGDGTKDEQMVVKENDQVLYGKYAGTEIEFEGEKYLIMRQSDILAILK